MTPFTYAPAICDTCRQLIVLAFAGPTIPPLECGASGRPWGNECHGHFGPAPDDLQAAFAIDGPEGVIAILDADPARGWFTRRVGGLDRLTLHVHG